MKHIIFETLFFITLFQLHSEVKAQPDFNTAKNLSCVSDRIHTSLMKLDSDYRDKYTKMSLKMATMMDSAINNKNYELGLHNEEWTIPVVVHVISDGQFSISDQNIIDAIGGLNDRFRGRLGNGPDTRINFCLASKAPNGSATNGIVRVNGSHISNYINSGIESRFDCFGASESSIKNLSKWPNDKYYNIWIVNKICDGKWGGYAYYPTFNLHELDGTVIIHNGMRYNYDLLTHEVGHGLNLAHTFTGATENSCPINNNCTLDGDGVCDTPPHRENDCGIVNPCTAFGNWNYSRFNYMSYCNMNINEALFTPQQATRMRLAIQTYRSSLIVSNPCSGITCQPPSNNLCSNAITISSNGSCLSGTIACATQSIPPATCNGYTSTAAPDVWYKFVAISNTHTITVNPSASLDAVIELRRGPNCNGTRISCRDNAGGAGRTETLNETGLQVGETYFIRVYPYYLNNPPSSTTFQICITHTGTQTCATPAGTNESNISQTSLTLLWNSVPSGSNYTYQYRVSGTTSWTTASVSNSSIQISGLSCDRVYEWQVRANCTNNISSNYSSTRTFKTSNCGTSCTPVSITSHPLNQVINAGSTASFTVSVSGTPPFKYAWYKNDNLLNLNLVNDQNFTNTYSTSPLTQADNGSFYFCFVTNCNDFQGAKTNTAFITINAPACPTPLNPNESNILNTTATLSWSNVATASNYTYRYRKSGVTTWSSINTANVLNGISDLNCNTNYEWQVRANCTSSNSEFTPIKSFRTTGTTLQQPAAISGSSSVCTGTTNAYSISPVPRATSYTWSYSGGGTPSGAGTSITLSPTSSGTLRVVANNACGSSTERTMAITAIQPFGSVGSIAVSSIVCNGAAITYSISPVAGASSYQWTLPSGWTGSSTTNSINAKAGSTGGTLSVRISNACNTITRSLSVSIGQLPAQPNAISGNRTICTGISTTYTITPVEGATSYRWSYTGGGTPTGRVNSTTFSPTSSGTLSVVAQNGCGNSTPRSVSIVVNHPPASVGPISGLTTVCEGASTTYAINQVSGASSYTWTLPQGWTGNSTSNSITVISGNSSGSIGVHANNNCGSGQAHTINITVNPKPNQPGTINGSSNLCLGSTNIYSIGSVQGATSYTWQFTGGGTPVGSSRSISFNPTSSGTLSVVGNNACGSGITRTLNITVNQIPKIQGKINGNATPCRGFNQTYSITPVSGASSYQWEVPFGWIGNSVTNNITVQVGNSNGIVRVRAINQCGESDWEQMPVINKTPPPQPSIIIGNQKPCETIATQYAVQNLLAADSYTWTKPAGWIGNSTTRTLLTTPSLTGGTITVRGNNVCGAGPVRSISVEVIPKVTPSITISELNCRGNTIQFSANISNGGTNPTFQWMVDGVPDGTNSPTFTMNFAINGMEVKCILTSNAQCPVPAKVESNVALVSCAAPPVIQVECIELYLVYPNPANQQVFTKIRTTCSKKIALNLINSKGQIVKQTKELEASGYITEAFKTNNLANGIYYLILMVDGKSFPTKIIVSH